MSLVSGSEVGQRPSGCAYEGININDAETFLLCMLSLAGSALKDVQELLRSVDNE